MRRPRRIWGRVPVHTIRRTVQSLTAKYVAASWMEQSRRGKATSGDCVSRVRRLGSGISTGCAIGMPAVCLDLVGASLILPRSRSRRPTFFRCFNPQPRLFPLLIALTALPSKYHQLPVCDEAFIRVPDFPGSARRMRPPRVRQFQHQEAALISQAAEVGDGTTHALRYSALTPVFDFRQVVSHSIKS